MSNIGSQLYSGAADFGRFRAKIALFIGCIISVIAILFGISMVLRHTKLTAQTSGRIIKITEQCEQVLDNDGQHQRYICEPDTIEYTVDGKNYQITRSVISKTQFRKLQFGIVQIYYDPTNPSHADTRSDDMKTVGMLAIGFGLIVLALAYLSYWMVNKYKFAAAASGVGGAADIMRDIF